MNGVKRRVLIATVVIFCSLTAIVSTAVALPPIQRTVLANGLTLLVSEEHSLPFITFLLLIKAGAKDDPGGQEGAADLTGSSLLLGAAGRTLKQINQDLDYMGAGISSGANKDFTTVSLRTMKKDIKKAFPIFMDVLTKPTFPTNELKKDISRVLGAIRSSEDQPGVVAERAFEKALYRGGPYAHPTEGTKESVARLTREGLNAFHKKYYHPNNSILVVAGDTDEKMMREYVIPMLEKWQKKPVAPPAVQTFPAWQKTTERIRKPVSQSNILIGNRAMSRDNPDYYAATVLNHIFGGGGLGSRLMEDIRNKRGLAYSVESFFDARKLPGSFQISLQTKTESTDQALNAVMEDVRRIRSEPVSNQELADAKSYLVGSFPQRLSSQSRIAAFFSQVEYYGLGLDYAEKYPTLINAVTAEDLVRIARAYILPEQFVVIVVTNTGTVGQ